MPRWIIGIVALVIAVSSMIVIRSTTRHAEYEAALTKYSQALKPGVTRKQVLDYVRSQGVRFGQGASMLEYCNGFGFDGSRYNIALIQGQ